MVWTHIVFSIVCKYIQCSIVPYLLHFSRGRYIENHSCIYVYKEYGSVYVTTGSHNLDYLGQFLSGSSGLDLNNQDIMNVLRKR